MPFGALDDVREKARGQELEGVRIGADERPLRMTCARPRNSSSPASVVIQDEP